MAIATLTIDLVAKLGELESGLTRATQIAERNASKIEGAFNVVTRTIGGLASGAIFGVLASEVIRVVGALDDLADAARGLGVPAEQLSAFQLSAQAAGVSSEDFGGALNRLNNLTSEASAGSKQAQQVFRALGVSFKDASGNARSTADVLGDIADKFSAYPDGVRKSALANELFGRSGSKLVAFLSEGREGLEKFGGASREQIESAQRLQGSIDQLSARWEKLKFSVAGGVASLLPGADAGAETLDEQLAGVGRQIDQVRTKLATVEEPALLAAWQIALEGLEGQAERLRGKLDELNQARFVAGANAARRVDFPLQVLTGEDIAKSDAAIAAAAKQAAEAAAAFGKYQDALYANALAVANAEQAYIRLEEAADAKMWDDYIAGVRLAEQAEQDLTNQVLELAGVLGEQRKIAQAQKLDELARQGLVSAEQAERAVKAIAGIRDEVDKAQDASDRLALSFASSIGRLIDSGGDAGDVFKALLQDITKLIVQLTVIEPLARRLKELFSSTGGGSGSWLNGLFGVISGGGGTAGSGAPSSAVKPAGATAGAGAPVFFNFDYSGMTIGAGASRAEIAAAMEQSSELAIAKIEDRLARGRLRVA
jgi:hypothetical protein